LAIEPQARPLGPVAFMPHQTFVLLRLKS